MANYPKPFPIFDAFEIPRHINSEISPPKIVRHDLKLVFNFLRFFCNNKNKQRSYRCEMERLLLWAWLVAKKSVLDLQYQDIQKFLLFRLHPPVSWISTRQNSHFIKNGSIIKPNPHWRPFAITPIKYRNITDEKLYNNECQLTKNETKQILNVLAMLEKFYNDLLLKGEMHTNSIALVLAQQKSKFILTKQAPLMIKPLTEIQWQYCLKTAELLAADRTDCYEITLFIISIFYFLYPHTFELIVRGNWTPQMNHFYQDSNQNWWFKVLYKKNKTRVIPVGNEMLKVLKRYRLSRGLTPLPLSTDSMPLLLNKKGNAIACTRVIDWIVQHCFEKTIEKLQEDGLVTEADTMKFATIKTLRQTGILNDVNKQGYSIQQLYDKLGQSLSATTIDQPNEVQLNERHTTARNKKLMENFDRVTW